MAETCRRLRCSYYNKFTYLSIHLLVLVLTLWSETPHFTIFLIYRHPRILFCGAKAQIVPGPPRFEVYKLTQIDTHTHTVGLLCMRDLVAEAATDAPHNKHKRRPSCCCRSTPLTARPPGSAAPSTHGHSLQWTNSGHIVGFDCACLACWRLHCIADNHSRTATATTGCQ